jgi:hypothetical protein
MAMVKIEAGNVPLSASQGAEAQARRIATMVERARDWSASIFGMTPAFRLDVSGPDDWPTVAAAPGLTYGLPHTSDEGDRLIVGAEPGAFFAATARSYLPYTTPETREALVRAFGQELHPATFVDAIVVHELGHLYHQQVPFDFPHLWLMELFANLVMVGYAYDVEPALVPGVEAYASAAVQAAGDLFPGSRLEDMTAPPAVSAETYVWYEMVLIAGACALWRAAGANGLRRMHTDLRDPSLDLAATHARLGQIHPAAARIIDDWPNLDHSI